MLTSHRIFSIFLPPPANNNRQYYTFLLFLYSLTLLGGIYWWHLQTHALFLIPILATCVCERPLLKIALVSTFCFSALYCSFLEFSYKKIQQSLAEKRSSGAFIVHDIAFNPTKKLYTLSGDFSPENSLSTAHITIFTKQELPIELGDKIMLKNSFFKPPHQPSYALFLLKESIHATLYNPSIETVHIAQKKSYSSSTKLFFYDLEMRIAKKISRTTQLFFSSFFFGSKKYNGADHYHIKEYFNRWGINHFLARSGLHVSLIVVLLLAGSRMLILPFYARQTLIITFLIGYNVLSYFSVSFMRAIITALLVLWCITVKIPINSLHLLLISLIIVLLYNPFFALFLDFQLTYLLTAGLCCLSLIKNRQTTS